MDQKKVKEILDVYLSGEKDAIENGFALRNRNIPKSLYRYRPIKWYTWDEIEKNHIRLSIPSEFNDPFDSEPVFFHIMKLTQDEKMSIAEQFHKAANINKDEIVSILDTKTPILNLIRRLREKRPIAMQQAVEELKQKYIPFKKDYHETLKICCYTESNTNIPMWYHYADKFTGICIEYDMRPNGNGELPKYPIFPVYYMDSLESSESVLVNRYLNTNCDRSNIPMDILMGTPYYKFRKWEYEEEWRCVQVESGKSESYVSPIPIKSIFMGEKIIKEDMEKLALIAKRQNIELFKMEISPTGIGYIPYMA